MPIARVVTFDGVSSERMAEMQREMQGNERPESVPAKEIIVLHDPEAEKSLVVVFFETEDDYRQGDEALSAMPTGDTPGKRTSVTKYQVAFRMTD
jgi:heme-degrading monooxygenase HmoA